MIESCWRERDKSLAWRLIEWLEMFALAGARVACRSRMAKRAIKLANPSDPLRTTGLAKPPEAYLEAETWLKSRQISAKGTQSRDSALSEPSASFREREMLQGTELPAAQGIQTSRKGAFAWRDQRIAKARACELTGWRKSRRSNRSSADQPQEECSANVANSCSSWTQLVTPTPCRSVGD